MNWPFVALRVPLIHTKTDNVIVTSNRNSLSNLCQMKSVLYIFLCESFIRSVFLRIIVILNATIRVRFYRCSKINLIHQNVGEEFFEQLIVVLLFIQKYTYFRLELGTSKRLDWGCERCETPHRTVKMIGCIEINWTTSYDRIVYFL